MAARIKRVIDTLPYAGYRTVAWLLGENKNTVQRIFQLKGWQVRKRRSGHRPEHINMSPGAAGLSKLDYHRRIMRRDIPTSLRIKSPSIEINAGATTEHIWMNQLIKDFCHLIPSHLLSRSGKVFYSGNRAFSGNPPLYILGANPGGDPIKFANETIGKHLLHIGAMPENWSAYRDESWAGKAAGSGKMQPRLLYMFKRLSLDAGQIPASNLVFVRSRRLKTLSENFIHIAEDCWSFHKLVIEELQPKVVLCLGKQAGKFVCKALSSNRQIDAFTERNNRKWTSRAYSSDFGPKIIVATHPGITDWKSPSTDPTAMIKRVLCNAH